MLFMPEMTMNEFSAGLQGSAPREFPDFPVGILVRNKQRYWPGGVWGDPAKASSEKGAALEGLVVNALDRLVTQLEDFEERD